MRRRCSTKSRLVAGLLVRQARISATDEVLGDDPRRDEDQQLGLVVDPSPGS
jgi:hypothetical protein